MKHKTGFTRSIGILALIAAIGTGTGSALASVSVDPAMTALANEIVSASTKISGSATLSAEIKPISETLNSATFDWNMALFGTDSTGGEQSAISSILVPAMRQLASFSVTTTGAATGLISGVVDGFQSMNASISTDDVVSFLQVMEQNTALQMLGALGQTSISNAQLESMIHTSVSAAVQASSPLIATAFANTGGSGSLGTSTGTGVSSGDGQATGASTGSTSGSSAGSGGTTTSSGSGSLGSGGTAGTSSGSGSSDASGSSDGASTASKAPANGGSRDTYGVGPAGVYVNHRLAAKTSFVHKGQWTYVSVYSTIQALKDFKVNSHWNGRNLYLTLPKGWVRVSFHALTTANSDDVGLYVDGKHVGNIGKLVQAIPTSRQVTTFVPVGQLIHALRTLGFTVQSNGRQMNIRVDG